MIVAKLLVGGLIGRDNFQLLEVNVMAKVKYKIRTFRGFDYAEDFSSAIEKAKSMLLDIIVDRQKKMHWWAVVYPLSGRGKSAYVSCDGINEWFIVER